MRGGPTLCPSLLGGQRSDRRDLVRCERDAGRRNVLPPVLPAGCARNRERSARAMQLPGEGDLLRRGAVLLGDGIDYSMVWLALFASRERRGMPGRKD